MDLQEPDVKIVDLGNRIPQYIYRLNFFDSSRPIHFYLKAGILDGRWIVFTTILEANPIDCLLGVVFTSTPEVV